MTLTDTDSTYEYCAGPTGGVFYLTSTSLTMTRPSFNNIIAMDGGVYYLLGDNTLSHNTVTATNIEARNDGGFIYDVSATPASDTVISFSNTNTLTNITA